MPRKSVTLQSSAIGGSGIALHQRDAHAPFSEERDIGNTSSGDLRRMGSSMNFSMTEYMKR